MRGTPWPEVVPATVLIIGVEKGNFSKEVEGYRLRVDENEARQE